jgi:hypothetical protein
MLTAIQMTAVKVVPVAVKVVPVAVKGVPAIAEAPGVPPAAGAEPDQTDPGMYHLSAITS